MAARASASRPSILDERRPYQGAGHGAIRVPKWQQRTADLGIAPFKGHHYLNWKYIGRPDLDVVPYQAVDSAGQLIGFVVVINPDEKHKAASIAELVASDTAIAGALLDEAIAHCRRAGAERIAAVATDPRYRRTLESRWFLVRPPEHPLFLANAPHSAPSEKLRDPANWHVSLGDSEGPF